MTLTPCPRCDRHVRVAAAPSVPTQCPFCASAVAPAQARPRPLERLGRAALVAFGTTLAATACGGSSTAEEGSSADRTSGDEASADPTAPARPDTPPSQPGPPDDGGVVALYGAPAPMYGTPP